MKKKVNGKVIDIANIELFEKAAEGAVIDKMSSSKIADKLTVESEVINDCINRYEAFYRALPFPLYSIEENIKYAAIGTFIKSTLTDELLMWVDEALFICIDKENNMALKIVSNTWGVIKADCNKTDNTDIENFKSNIGYAEYSWIIGQVLKKESTSGFYTKFMGEFVEACKNDPIILKWELGNILNFGSTPDKIRLVNNKIINLDTGSEFMVDIYTKGYKKTQQNEYVMSLVDDSDVSLRAKTVKVYDFETYEKPGEKSLSVMTSDNSKSGFDRMQKNSLIGINNLFQTLASIKLATEQKEFEDFQGFIADRDMIYTINKRVFVCKAFKFVETKEIARGVEIYSFDKGLVYMCKSIKIARGITKEVIYSYSLRDETIRLCKTQFIM